MPSSKGGCNRPRGTTRCEGSCGRKHRGEGKKSAAYLGNVLTMTSPVKNSGNPSSQPDEHTGVTIIRLNRNGERTEEIVPKDPFKE